jgi:hypothetical protein
MLRINCEQWISLNRLMPVWSNDHADGTTEADLWCDVCRVFKDGHLDDGGPRYLLIDSGQVLSPKDPQLWRYLRPLGDRIVLSNQPRVEGLLSSAMSRSAKREYRPTRSKGRSKLGCPSCRFSRPMTVTWCLHSRRCMPTVCRFGMQCCGRQLSVPA